MLVTDRINLEDRSGRFGIEYSGFLIRRENGRYEQWPLPRRFNAELLRGEGTDVLYLFSTDDFSRDVESKIDEFLESCDHTRDLDSGALKAFLEEYITGEKLEDVRRAVDDYNRFVSGSSLPLLKVLVGGQEDLIQQQQVTTNGREFLR